jgi:glycosyltransferase involved in cell wall biosynthesis
MRICHVSPHLPPDQAANALLPAELAAWQQARGDVVTLVAHEPAQGRQPTDLSTRTVRWVPRRARGNPLSRALRIETMRTARAIRAAVSGSASGADLLHLHSNGLIVEVAARWAVQHGIPYVLTLYGTEIWHYRRKRPIDLFTRAYRHAAAVTFYSERLLDRARELGLDRDGLSVVYPAVNEVFHVQNDDTRRTWRAAFGIREPIVVLNVKRLHELAGQRHLIDAFAAIARRRSDVRLVICGTGPLRADLETQARAAGIADRVTFAGLVANDVVAQYASVADVFALPSLLEALPTVAVEALACGTPVVSADHPGGVELHAIFGDDVQVVPKADATRLAEALEAAIAAPRRAREASLRLVESTFRRAAVDAAYVNVYQRVLAATRPRGALR